MLRTGLFSLIKERSQSDLRRIQDAYWLVEEACRYQFRDNGEPALVHPVGVARILIDRGHSASRVLVLALLHDVAVEDGCMPERLITRTFGPTVWTDLNVLSKVIPVFDPVSGDLLRKEHKPLGAYYAGIARAGLDVRLVKLADKLHNQRSSGHWSPPRRRKYALEAREHIYPIAERTDARFAADIRQATDDMDPGPDVVPEEPRSGRS